ncbi:MAG: sigma-70 family RNA polymerase sigma factor [bacterium]|nr:sigma-70 family RNA polymerase sigma factor [bacterium]
MNTTRASLLIRIKDPDAADAWSEFHDLYAPLIYRYGRRRGLSRDDADDVRSECYQAIVRQIRTFDYDKTKGGFKAWLRTMVDRRVIDLFRKKREQQANSGDLRQLEAVHPSPEEVWEMEWTNQHLKHCVEQLRSEVSRTTFEAFSIVVIEGRPVAEACDVLGMNANQVYKAKARMLRRVREKMAELGCEEASGS